MRKPHPFSHVGAGVLVGVAWLLANSHPLAAERVTLPALFDFGSRDSPLASSALNVSGRDYFETPRGYGFESRGQVSFDRDKPLPELRHGGNPMRPDLLYRSHANALTRDGVASRRDISFRVDVEPGNYRLQVWVGDLHAPLESLALECNGRTVASGISAKHIIGRGQPESTGHYRWLRFNVHTTDGIIRLRFFGDETRYEADRRRYEKWFSEGARVESYLGQGWDPKRRLKFDPGGPFTRNSVLALRVAELSSPLVQWRNGRLVAEGQGDWTVDAFLMKVNAGQFGKAEALLGEASVSGLLRVRGYLALSGHPQVEGEAEERLLGKAQQAVERRLKEDASCCWTLEARDSLQLFSRARRRFLGRGSGEEGHFQENRKVVSMMRLFHEEDLMYPKALVYQGRALQMLDPHRWVYPSGDAQAVWKKLQVSFPANRYVRFYLHDEWTADSVWHHGHHLMNDARAPKWALAQREAWGLLLDMCEWWAANKQQPDGGIGGGWGDDVELVALFGLMGFISENASQPSLDLATKLIDGLWKYGAIDQDAGFYRGVLDTEHSSEWTGDTLPLMLTIDWGNPLWVERATQSAHLMRTLWMDYNDRGDLHFRSNFLGSIAVGNEAQANDSYINYRAALPAVAAYRYNQNPTIGKLLVEWADAWLNDAMRTDRGKPRGVFPSEVGFPNGELGGVNSPNWHTAAHPPGTVNYDWQRGRYYFYLVDLMFLAHEITGDDKYLEPFVLQKKLVDRYRADDSVDPTPGTGLWAGKVLGDGSRRGAMAFDVIWKRLEKLRSATIRGEVPVLIEKSEVLEKMDRVRREAKQRWPVLTTEASATDRVGFRGIADPFSIMTGAGGTKPSVTYSGVGRDFAAFVRRQDEHLLEIVTYSFCDEERLATLTPWKLEVGGRYRIRSGADTTGDDRPDTGITESTFTLARRGERVGISLPPRQTTVIEIQQVQEGWGTPLLADLALVPAEIKYSIWTRDVQTTLHNVGAKSADKIHVTFYESSGPDTERRKIGAVVVPHLSWPMDLTAKTLTIGLHYIPTSSKVTLSVVVDELNLIPELCESNNEASRTFAFDLEEIQAPRNRLGEIGGDVTGEIRRGIR